VGTGNVNGSPLRNASTNAVAQIVMAASKKGSNGRSLLSSNTTVSHQPLGMALLLVDGVAQTPRPSQLNLPKVSARKGLMARFGPDIALPDLLVALSSCERRADFSKPWGARYTDLAKAGPSPIGETMATSHEEPLRHYLREWREFRGLTQDDLALLPGTSQNEIADYETGERRISREMQFKLVWALGITSAQFFEQPE
jgi:hypothetical protein